MNRKRITSKAENKRIGHKRARSAEAQVLRGDYSKVTRGLNYGSKLPQPSLFEIDRPHRSKKNRRKWCKGQVGKEHGPFVKKTLYGWYEVTVCQRCSKRMWGK